MEPLTLRVCHLYPALLNIAGDRGNVIALQRRCAWRGLRARVTNVTVGETPDFTAFDLILFHGGQDKEMDIAARDLATKAPRLRDAIEADVVVLAVCAGYQLMGRYYQPARGPRLEGVGALDTHTEASSVHYMNHITVECHFAGSPQTLVGFENHSGRTILGLGVQPLGRVLAGGGEQWPRLARRRTLSPGLRDLSARPRVTEESLVHRSPDLAGPPAPLRRHPPAGAAARDTAEERAHQVTLQMALRSKGRMTALEATPW